MIADCLVGAVDIKPAVTFNICDIKVPERLKVRVIEKCTLDISGAMFDAVRMCWADNY